MQLFLAIVIASAAMGGALAAPAKQVRAVVRRFAEAECAYYLGRATGGGSAHQDAVLGRRRGKYAERSWPSSVLLTRRSNRGAATIFPARTLQTYL